ncbi:MAG: hypothetical protein U9N81_04260 [Bacillota bacterium]|nr:hypothetical protein [Bacillota bacterium]MEA1960494.1 hypothetical protein [Bacillota bacterium]
MGKTLDLEMAGIVGREMNSMFDKLVSIKKKNAFERTLGKSG